MDGVIGRTREAGERVVKVSQGIDAPAAVGFHDRVNLMTGMRSRATATDRALHEQPGQEPQRRRKEEVMKNQPTFSGWLRFSFESPAAPRGVTTSIFRFSLIVPAQLREVLRAHRLHCEFDFLIHFWVSFQGIQHLAQVASALESVT